MYKLILLAVSAGSFLLANVDSQFDVSKKSSNTNGYNWEEGSDDNLKSDAGRRRGKGPRGRRRGGSGLR